LKELIHAEAYLLKALLSIIHDESVVSFVREGFNIRNSYNTYITLAKYIKFVQQEAAKGKDVKKYGLDEHFTSGVCLGVGTFNIILSMLPASVIKVVEFIGFSVDRAHGLHVLTSAGGWDDIGSDGKPLDGLRRQLCDMVLILYNIVLADLIPLSHVNLSLAQRILDHNLDQYPAGVFFLYFNGRRLVNQGKLDQAEQQYQKAIDTQKDWKQLQHMCYWDLGVIAFIQKKWTRAYDIYSLLKEESNWSQAAYNYLMAISLYMQVDSMDIDEDKQKKKEQVQALMEKVPISKKKMAGKSIPMEVSFNAVVLCI
jgi:tetratricopeptide (TPR) repeat protein